MLGQEVKQVAVITDIRTACESLGLFGDYILVVQLSSSSYFAICQGYFLISLFTE